MCLGKLFMGETPKTTLSASVEGKNFTQVENLEIPENGLIVHLKKFGQVKVFRRIFKNEIPPL